MKIKALILSIMFLFVASLTFAFSVSYSNKDSRAYKWEVKINGSTRTIEFKSGTSGTASVSMNADKIEIKTDCGWVAVKNGDKITIKNGCISIN